MIGVVVVTHGQLAAELVSAAETIVGDLPQMKAVSIGWHEDVQDARQEIASAIDAVSSPEGVAKRARRSFWRAAAGFQVSSSQRWRGSAEAGDAGRSAAAREGMSALKAGTRGDSGGGGRSREV